MIDAFAEAVRDLALPCSLTLVIPGVAASLSARSNPLAVATSTFAGTAVVGWLRISGQIPSSLTWWSSMGVGILVLVAYGALFARATRPGQRVTAGLVVGASAASIWTPCVGEQLGSILNRAPEDAVGVALPFIAFIAGISIVAIAVALARVGFDPPESVSTFLSRIGVAMGLAIAVLIGSGLYSNVVAQLVTWSL